jgi:hypothetical protein
VGEKAIAYNEWVMAYERYASWLDRRGDRDGGLEQRRAISTAARGRLGKLVARRASREAETEADRGRWRRERGRGRFGHFFHAREGSKASDKLRGE